MTKKEFIEFGLALAKDAKHQESSYFIRHSQRFYETFQICKKLTKEHGFKKILSVGAGSGYVEIALKHALGLEVAIVDFQEAIDKDAMLYSKWQITPLAVDLSSDCTFSGDFDLVLSCEIVEHIPQDPALHFKKLKTALKQGGYILITTPNLRRIELIIELLKGRRIFPKPSAFFSKPSYENEAIHRREYLEVEMIDALSEANFKHEKTYFIWNESKKQYRRFKRVVCLPFEALFPFFRRVMILIAKSSD